jgi:hypothetical protein
VAEARFFTNDQLRSERSLDRRFGQVSEDVGDVGTRVSSDVEP